jgi:molybdenum cofactor biosynthesis protein B
MVVKYCENAGHFVVGRTLLPDERQMIQKSLAKAIALKNVDVIIINGGTGISPTDITVEAVQRFFAKVMRGFGELFRRISYETIGPAAMMSRAVAGVTKEGKAVFCLPGSPDGVDTAMRKLIIPELPHIVKLARGS